MQNIIELPDDIIYSILDNIPIKNKYDLRISCKKFNNSVDYMKLRVAKFDKKMLKASIPFNIENTTTTKYIPLGMMIEWSGNFCFCKNNIARQSNTKRLSKLLSMHCINESMYEVCASHASDWLYEAIINWTELERYKYMT